jgi:hypothetical protein
MLKVFTGILSLFHSPGATTLDKELAYSNRALSDNWKELASIRQKNKVSPQPVFVEQSKKLLKDRHNLYAKQRGLASSKFPRGTDDITIEDNRGDISVGTYTFDTCFGFQSKEMSSDTWDACKDTLKSLNEHWCKWHNDKTFCDEAMKCFDIGHNHLFGAGNDKLYGAGKHHKDGNCIECLFNNKGPVTGAICSGHGSCDNTNPKCDCKDGYEGDDCSKCKLGYKLKSKRTCSGWVDGQTCAGGIGRKEKEIEQQVDFYSAEDNAKSNDKDFNEEYEHNFYDAAENKADIALKECQDWCDSYERSGRHDFCCQYDPDTHKCYYSHSTEVHKFKPRRFRTRVCKTQKIENECVKCDMNERPSVHPILRTNICVPCPPHNVYNQALKKCEHCPEGQYTDGIYNSKQNCLVCPVGSYCSGGAKKKCDAGTYQDEEEKAECKTCKFLESNGDLIDSFGGNFAKNQGASGVAFCNETNMTKVNLCDFNQYTNNNGDECADCPAGHYASNRGVCIQCAAGTELNLETEDCSPCASEKVNNTQNSACTTCPTGSVTNSDQSKCVTCAAGQYANAGLCIQCDTGHISSEGATECTACDEGEGTNANHTVCENCPAGKYDKDGSGTSACVDCEAGSYRATSSECDECPAGTWDHDSNSSTQCKTCSAGSYSPGNLGPCVECPAGTWDHDSDSSTLCKTCSAGSYSPGNLGPCDECSAGSVDHDENSASPCKICTPGTYQDSPAGIGACLHCPPGTIAPNAGAYGCDMCDSGTSAVNSITCTSCEPGTYDDDMNPETTCVECPAGKAAFDAGETECVRCRPGMFSGSGDATCSACSAGKFSKYWETKIECTDCPAGKSSNNKTMCTECKTCKTNHYASSPGMKVCEYKAPCADGQNRTESINGHDCEDCARGYGGKNEQCHICASGKYSDTTKATECILKKTEDECEYNEILHGTSNLTKDNECVACEAGQYILENKCVNKTKTCENDQGIIEIDNNDYEADNQCGTCGPQQIIKIEHGFDKCSDCGDGTSKNGTICSSCEVGKAGTSGECNECDDGKYSDTTKATECILKTTECDGDKVLTINAGRDVDNTCTAPVI